MAFSRILIGGAESLPLIKWKSILENTLVPLNSFHTSSERMKQRNPFSLAEAKLRREQSKRPPSTGVRLTGTNDVIYRRNLPRVFNSWETGVAYLMSETYHSTYGDKPIWAQYRRNHKGNQYFPPKPRRSCFTPTDHFLLNNPCPLCRDEYLVVDYRNPELLKQFIDRLTGEFLDIKKTGLCISQYMEVKVQTLKSKEHGYLEFAVPFRNYDYRHYYAAIEKESDDDARKHQHVVDVSDTPQPYPDKRPYPFVKHPEHLPEHISIYDIL